MCIRDSTDAGRVFQYVPSQDLSGMLQASVRPTVAKASQYDAEQFIDKFAPQPDYDTVGYRTWIFISKDDADINWTEMQRRTLRMMCSRNYRARSTLYEDPTLCSTVGRIQSLDALFCEIQLATGAKLALDRDLWVSSRSVGDEISADLRTIFTPQQSIQNWARFLSIADETLD